MILVASLFLKVDSKFKNSKKTAILSERELPVYSLKLVQNFKNPKNRHFELKRVASEIFKS